MDVVAIVSDKGMLVKSITAVVIPVELLFNITCAKHIESCISFPLYYYYMA